MNETKFKPKVCFKEFKNNLEQHKLSEVVEVRDGDRGKNYLSGKDFLDKGHTIFLNAGNVTKK